MSVIFLHYFRNMNCINYTYVCYIFELFQKYEVHKLYICLLYF